MISSPFAVEAVITALAGSQPVTSLLTCACWSAAMDIFTHGCPSAWLRSRIVSADPRPTCAVFSAFAPAEVYSASSRISVACSFSAAKALPAKRSSLQGTPEIKSQMFCGLSPSFTLHGLQNHFRKNLRLNIASGQHRHGLARRQLVRVKHGSRRGHSAAGLGQNARGKQQPPHRPPDLVFRHRNNFIHIFADVLKVDLANAL